MRWVWQTQLHPLFLGLYSTCQGDSLAPNTVAAHCSLSSMEGCGNAWVPDTLPRSPKEIENGSEM